MFSSQTIRFLENIPSDYLSLTLGKQLLRSATSVGANVVEAYGASPKKDFANFYNHALKSANESIYWLELLKDSNRGEVKVISSLIDECRELSKILGASLVSLRKKRI